MRIHQSEDLNVRGESITHSSDMMSVAFFAAHAITNRLETPFMAIGCVDVLPTTTHLGRATREMAERGPSGMPHRFKMVPRSCVRAIRIFNRGDAQSNPKRPLSGLVVGGSERNRGSTR